MRPGEDSMPEFPFLTITKLPPGFLVHLGGMVSKQLACLLVATNRLKIVSLLACCKGDT